MNFEEFLTYAMLGDTVSQLETVWDNEMQRESFISAISDLLMKDGFDKEQLEDFDEYEEFESVISSGYRFNDAEKYCAIILGEMIALSVKDEFQESLLRMLSTKYVSEKGKRNVSDYLTKTSLNDISFEEMTGEIYELIGWKKDENSINAELLSELKKQQEKMHNEIMEVKELEKENAVKIEVVQSEVRDIRETVDEMSKTIYGWQKTVSERLKKCKPVDEENEINYEEEDIISEFFDKCIDMYQKKMEEEASWKDIEKKLETDFQDAWKLLSKESKKWIVSAMVTYKALGDDENADYSGVTILITKALEYEMKKRFYFDYKAFIEDEQKGKDHIVYPYGIYRDGKLVTEGGFTLGSVPFVLFPKKDDDKERLYRYSRKKLVKDPMNKQELLSTFQKYSNEIKSITREFRNPSAHPNEIKRDKAEACIEKLITVEKLLKEILDMFTAEK